MEKYKYGERLAIYEPIDLAANGQPYGSQARVFLGKIKHENQIESVAVKLRRTEDVFEESFLRELRILHRLDKRLSVMTPVLDCGIMRLSETKLINNDLVGFDGCNGTVEHFGADGLMELHEKLKSDGFHGLPFIALQLRSNMEINLDDIVVDGTRDKLPLSDVLSIGKQLMEILKESHRNDVIYADSRPIHFYISFQDNGQMHLKVIDWNASTILSEIGLDPVSAKQKDLKEIVANILYPLFTGRRLKNSSESMGRDQGEVLNHLNTKYSIEWKKEEEERLDKETRELLFDTVVNETITTTEQFLERLTGICANWLCNENGDLSQALRKLHLAYCYLNESHGLLEKVTEDLFRAERSPFVRKEVERLFYMANDMKMIWRLYPNQIKRMNESK